ncbi:hypothetical protein Aperf_G00000086457 [Anoplocephala perfoliata]
MQIYYQLCRDAGPSFHRGNVLVRIRYFGVEDEELDFADSQEYEFAEVNVDLARVNNANKESQSLIVSATAIQRRHPKRSSERNPLTGHQAGIYLIRLSPNNVHLPALALFITFFCHKGYLTFPRAHAPSLEYSRLSPTRPIPAQCLLAGVSTASERASQ